ncbi:MAG: serine/threonine protein kinase [Kiritimatiellae bacterium]|nr:serine/threonine protein kinase [Kiritimatiellia bacterium]
MENPSLEQTLPDGTHFGNFTVTRLLGKGGMGEVYLVEDPVAREFFAVKILSPGKGDEAESRFINEAEFAMNSPHKNLLGVYDAGKDPETGLCYMTMEYMPRGSLKDLIERKEKLDISEVVSISSDIASALAAIESRGLVHRDIKPGNILIASDGHAKLSDFGISRSKEFSPDANVTQAEDILGTPAYMAPEQMLDSRKVDIRSDIYSLGVVMYEMLALVRPYEGEGAMTTLARALEGRRPPDVRLKRKNCPGPLARLIAAMMMPDADSRPADAATIVALLAHPEQIGPAREQESAKVRWYDDRATLYALVALIFSLEALFVALVTIFTRRP